MEKDTGVKYTHTKLALDGNLGSKIAHGLGWAVGIANAVHLGLMLWKMSKK